MQWILKNYFHHQQHLVLLHGNLIDTECCVWKPPITGSIGDGYVFALTKVNYSTNKKTGNTQFHLLFAKGDNDDLAADYMCFFSGNYSSTSAHPKLIIKYYVP